MAGRRPTKAEPCDGGGEGARSQGGATGSTGRGGVRASEAGGEGRAGIFEERALEGTLEGRALENLKPPQGWTGPAGTMERGHFELQLSLPVNQIPLHVQQSQR